MPFREILVVKNEKATAMVAVIFAFGNLPTRNGRPFSLEGLIKAWSPERAFGLRFHE